MQGGDFLRCTGACQSWEGGQGGWVAGQRETGSTYSRSRCALNRRQAVSARSWPQGTDDGPVRTRLRRQYSVLIGHRVCTVYIIHHLHHRCV
jgi:hypothetical protein